MTSMTEVTVKDAVDCIMLLDNNTPAFMWGEPGLGKTQALMAAAKKKGYTVIPVLAGQSEPADIGGIPFNYEDKYAKYVVPWWGYLSSTAVPKKDQKPTILFFDDLPTAHEQTQAAFYKIVDEKRIGDLFLRDNVKIVGAGNRVDDLSAVTDMPKALCNRFLHLYVKPDPDAWLEWATSAGVHPHVVFFLRQNSHHISEFEAAKDSTECHAWATARTWEMLSRCLFTLEEAGLRDSANELGSQYERTMIQGCIGALASSFIAHIRTKYQVIPIEDILKNPAKAIVPEEVDRLFATMSNLEYWFTKLENHKHYEAYITYASRFPEDYGLVLKRHFVNQVTRNDEQSEKNRDLYDEVLGSELFQGLLEGFGDKLDVDIRG